MRELVRDLAAAAEEQGVGLAILIGEAQGLNLSELVTLGAIAHEAGEEGLRVLFAVAGLPSLRRILVEAKSFAEIFNFEKIEELSGASAAEGLITPAAVDGIEWDKRAVELVLKGSGDHTICSYSLVNGPKMMHPRWK